MDLLEGLLYLIGNLCLMRGVELVVFEPLATVEIHLVRSFPLSDYPVVPRL